MVGGGGWEVHWEQAVHLSSEDGDTWSGGGGRGVTTATTDCVSFPFAFFLKGQYVRFYFIQLQHLEGIKA